MSNPYFSFFMLMKKTLLIASALLLSGLSLYAFNEPKVCENVSFSGIAPNGKTVVSEVYGSMIIFDLANDQEYSYESTGEDPYYTTGLGNAVSNTGIVLASTCNISDAAYWENGEWKQLDTEGAVSNCLSNGITPDGSRICGSIGAAPISVEENNMMLVPVYWDRNADGTYGKYNVLPHPELDLYGRVPQYVTANYISEDGKTIAGQIVDCSGFVYMPIVYKQDDEGKWSYKILLQEQFFPEGTVLPEDPGEAPERPEEADFMTEEELAEYDAAYQAYLESGYTLPFPEVTDYMTEEEKAAYEAALAEWEPKFAEWEEKSTAFMDAFYAVVEAAPQFEFNSVCLTPDGKTYLSTLITYDESDPDAWFPAEISSPFAINIEDETTTKYELEGGQSFRLTSVPNNEYCLASTGIGSIPMTSYIISLADDKITPVEEYLASFSPELKEWMDANLKHEVEIYDWETGESTFETLMYTGIAHASADMSTFTMWDDGSWGTDYIPGGVIIDLGQFSGICAPAAAAKANVRFDNNGNLIVEGNISNVELYDPAGRQVLSTNQTGATPCHLAKGVYIVKAVTSNGETFAAKIVR